MALLHKLNLDGLFSNIILQCISLHLKSPLNQLVFLYEQYTAQDQSIGEISRFGLILLLNGMLSQKANKDVIELILIQRFNAAVILPANTCSSTDNK